MALLIDWLISGLISSIHRPRHLASIEAGIASRRVKNTLQWLERQKKMDWKIFICILVLYEFIPETTCYIEAKNTFQATGIPNELVINIETIDEQSFTKSCLVFTDKSDDIAIYRIICTMCVLNHYLQAHGYYDVHLVCLTDSDYFSNYEYIYVGANISGLEIYNTYKIKPIQLHKPLTKDVAVEVGFEAGTDVNLTAFLVNTSHDPTNLTSVENGTFQFNFSKSLFVQSGIYVIRIEAKNPLSDSERFQVLAVEEPVNVGSIPFPRRPAYVMTNLSFDISPVLLAGENLIMTTTVRDYNLSNVVDVVGCCFYTSSTTCAASESLEKAGMYHITTYLSNYVSHQELVYIKNAIYEVNAFTAMVSSNVTLSSEEVKYYISVGETNKYPMGLVRCEVDFGDGSSESFTFDISTTIPQEVKSIAHLYEAGWYTAVLNCSNQLPFQIGSNVTTGEIFTFNLIVENPLANLELIHDSPNANYHPWSKPITIEIKLSDPETNLTSDNLTCIFAYGTVIVEETGAVSNTTHITHKVDLTKSEIKDKEFILTVNCSSILQSQILEQLFIINRCLKRDFFDSVFKDPSNAQRTQTDKAKSVYATFLQSEDCSLPYASSWIVFALTGVKQGNVIYTHSDHLNLVKTFPANTMDEGHYRISFIVNLTMDDGRLLSVEDFFYLNYTLPDILPAVHVNNIDNAMLKLYTGGITDISLNTNHTVDQADGLNSVVSLPLYKAVACATSTFWDDESVLGIMANESMFGIYDNCNDLIQPVPGGDIFLVSLRNVVEDRWYIFNVTVTRSNRTATIFQAVQPTGKLVPDISYQAVSNGQRTSSTFYKLNMADLYINVLSSLDNEMDETSVMYDWKMEMYNSYSLDYTPLLQITGKSNGFHVEKKLFQSGNGTKYKLSCTVSMPGYESVTIYRFYIMNQPPYNGNCSLDVADIPAIPGRTDVCFHCTDWKDEENKVTRDIFTDYGGSVTYVPVQKFLTVEGNVDQRIPEYKHLALPNVDRCFKLVTPLDRNSNQTRVEIRIQDEYLTPYSTVTFDDIEIETFPIASVEDVYAVYDSSAKELDENLKIEYIEEVINIVVHIATTINIHEEKTPPIMPYVDLEPEVGNMGDLSPNGTAIAFTDIMEDLTLPKTDLVIQAIQDANTKIIQALYNITMRKKSTLTMTQIQLIAECILIFTVMDEEYFNKTSLSMLKSETDIIFAVFFLMDEMDVLANEFRMTAMLLTNNLANTLVPDDLQYMEADVSLAGQRKRNEDALSFASSLYLKLKDTTALMTEEERDFYMMRQFLKIKSDVTEIIDLTKGIALQTKDLHVSMVTSAHVSNGADTVIGKNESFAKLMKISSRHLVNEKISAPTTAITIQELIDEERTTVTVGLFETSTVMNIDGNGKAATITSKQKRLILQTDGNIPENIRVTHNIPEIATETVTPVVNEEDASAFDYRLVLVDRASDDLNILVKPTLEKVKGYDVYIFYTDDAERQVSKIQYTAKAESRYPYYIARFPPNIRGSKTGVWQLGIETILHDIRTKHNSVNDTEPKYPPYQLATATMGCQTWDDGAETWRTDECKGTWKPEKSELECECKAKREMTFANSFYVQPNIIDFSTVFLKFSPLNQASVIATLALVFITYSFVIIWARRQDKKDLLKWGITPLRDNFSTDNYFYIIKVYTGIRPGAGTRSRVSFVLDGEELDTGIRELADGVRNEFQTGSIVTFLLATPLYLGDLVYIRLWHDNSGGGKHASWYLSRIELYDIQRDETFTFLVEQWLAVEEGVLECIVPVCKEDNVNIFKNRFISNIKENIAESHMWVSIAFRPHASHFTRVQRASCALVFIMLTMISNAMFFKGSNDENYETPAEVQVGPFRFSLHQIYISFVSALIVTPATLLVIYLFKMSKRTPKISDEVLYKRGGRSCCRNLPVIDNWLEKELEKSIKLEKELISKGYPEIKDSTLPESCFNFAWLIVVVATILPAFFTMLYSMEWGKQKSEEWITAFLLSFLESVLCLDPAKVLFIAMIFALVFRRMQLPEASVKRSFIWKNYSPEMRSKYFGIRTPAPPLNKKRLDKARAEKEREQKMKTSFVETIFCLILIWILISLSYSSRDERSFHMHQRILDTFIQPLDAPSFSSIKTTTDFFDWLNKTFIEKAFPETEHYDNNNNQLHWKYRAFIDGGELFRVGPPRLRQLRATEGRCAIPYFGSENCYKKYAVPYEDSKSYCIGWKHGPCQRTEKLNFFSSDAWTFTSALDIWGAPVAGLYTTYGGGGYIANLSVNRKISQLILDELYTNSWVDRQSRAVMIEFTLYCLNANIFAHNMFIVEFLETGGAFTFFSIVPLRVYHHLGSLGFYTMICELIFVLYLLIHSVIIIVNIVKRKKKFCRNNWNVYDIVFVLFGYVSIVLYIIQYILVEKSLDVFRFDKKQFVNFYHIAIWYQALVLAIGLLVFMAFIRLLRVLGYNKRIDIILNIFAKAAYDLFWFGLFFLFCFTAYAIFGYLLFGWKLQSYMNVLESMETLFISMLGKSRFVEMEETAPILSIFYFMIFILFVVYLILTMFLGILSKAIDDAAAETKTSKGDEMFDYLIGKIQQLFRGKSQNKVHSFQRKTVPYKYLYRWKIDDDAPQNALLEIKAAFINSGIAYSRDFTTRI